MATLGEVQASLMALTEEVRKQRDLYEAQMAGQPKGRAVDALKHVCTALETIGEGLETLAAELAPLRQLVPPSSVEPRSDFPDRWAGLAAEHRALAEAYESLSRTLG
ncbi:hypothetical protein [uncultured Microbacterium sp.]|uniref:Uncharacterized protein n=1 Tax=uncultured Microbacterium sp. TaxID=191216 RepID=A0A1Y5P3I0_9MICO|nr:hypothetical protein [uncultured Microbacterium sp.]SBS73213.1 hypothetical protein MIPYR_40044 [uncultured Microbacterium sp.]